jgi:DnaJ family protein C protein 28
MPGRDRAVEAIIRKAMEEGAFDNLRGKGKPLNLDENPFADPGWRMAYNMLKNEGFALPWMEKRSQIEDEVTAAREALARTWSWRQEKIDADQGSAFVEEEWTKSLMHFRQKVADLNKCIEDYNLEVPSDIFQRKRIDVEREVGEITK